MSIIGWIVLGLVAGFIASKIVNKQGEGFFLDIVLGIVGAVIERVHLRAVRRGGRHRLQPLQHDRRGRGRDHPARDLPCDFRPTDGLNPRHPKLTIKPRRQRRGFSLFKVSRAAFRR